MIRTRPGASEHNLFQDADLDVCIELEWACKIKAADQVIRFGIAGGVIVYVVYNTTIGYFLPTPQV